MNENDKLALEILEQEHEAISKSKIRELLILAMHSSVIANDYFENRIKLNDVEVLKNLIEVSKDLDDFGDAPHKASFYIKDYSTQALLPYEEILYNILSTDDRGARTFISIALGKLKSEIAKEYILNNSNDEELIDNWVYREAMSFYKT